jgi:hypothetical protein
MNMQGVEDGKSREHTTLIHVVKFCSCDACSRPSLHHGISKDYARFTSSKSGRRRSAALKHARIRS